MTAYAASRYLDDQIFKKDSLITASRYLDDQIFKNDSMMATSSL